MINNIHVIIWASKWHKIGIFWISSFLLKFSGDLKFLFSDLSAPMNSPEADLNQEASDGDLSIDLPANEGWEKRLQDVTLYFQGKIDGLIATLESKDKLISALSEKVGILSKEMEEVKKGLNFMSKDTADIKTKLSAETTHANKQINFLESKTQDLEDRSGRCNLIIFGVPEAPNVSEEDCDRKICSLLGNYGILDKKDVHQGLLERAHRLGRRKTENSRPRPIIVCCGSYKDKEYILQNSKKLKGTPYSIAEDFSRPTLEIRRKLVQKGKEAKEKFPSVKSFTIKYKRLVLHYLNPNTKMHLRNFTFYFS